MNPFGLLAFAVVAMTPAPQEAGPEPLDSLVQWALDHNPGIAAVKARARAAEASIAPAGSLPDPMLSLSLRNFPVSQPGFDDFMTMKVVGLSQRLPYPGKRSLATQAARQRTRAALADLDDLRLEVARDVRRAYYEVAYLDRALEVVARHMEVMSALAETTDAHYAVGTAAQEDVLKTLVESAALADEAARLSERRRGVVAELDRLLDRPPDSPVAGASIPDRIARAAVRAPERVGFESLRPGARVADSPVRPLAELMRAAEDNNPSVRASRARVEGWRSRLDLARKAHLPDVDVALSYGQRDGRTDMVSLNLAVPLPLNRGARQDAWSAAATAELAGSEAGLRDHVNGILARVATLRANLERDRTALALLTTGILPQAEAALQAATSGFRVGNTDFLTVLASQTTLFQYEINFHRTLADFARNVAELERVVGEEILR
jgi:outer membrane protein, heavy metal efflux system